MPDQREAVRSLPFPAVASAIGWDISKFTRKGKDWVGGCPLHGSKKNEGCFRYDATDGKFNCFGCPAKGRGAIDLTMLALKIGFNAAVERLSAIEPPKQKEPRVEALSENDRVLKPYTGKYEKYQVPCPWLEERIPDAGIREKYGIFCYNNPAKRSAYSGRVMIPVRDIDGVLYGYLGRDIKNNPSEAVRPKYLFPPGFPKSHFLFGAYQLRQHLSALGRGRSLFQQIYLVESPFAVMRFAMMGLPAVSSFGWSVSPKQITLLCQIARGVVYLPDGNKRQDAKSLVPVLASQLCTRFPELPAGITDPEYMSREQVLTL